MGKNNIQMTPKQQRVYNYIKNYIDNNYKSPTVLEVKEMLGAQSMRSVTQYLEALERKGLISRRRYANRGIELIESNQDQTISLPVFASAGCGSPSVIAERSFDEYTAVSKKLLPENKLDDLYIIRAVGNSMREANIKDGDLVLVEKTEQASDGDIVVAIIDDTAVIKKITYANNAIVLSPVTSDGAYQSIIMQNDFKIFGKVIRTIIADIDNEYQIVPIEDDESRGFDEY